MALKQQIARCAAAMLVTASSFVASARPVADGGAGIEFFEKKIRPLLVEKCYECHSAAATKVKGGLLLDRPQAWLKGGNSGPAVVPGNPDKSLLIQAVRYADEDLQMPPKHRLSAEQTADLERWVRMGAPAPKSDAPATDLAAAPAANATNHWSFQPVGNPAPPGIKNRRLAHNEIDRFIVAQLEARGLKPVPAADKRTLIRRATFDLTGLPPTPEEIDAFLADGTRDAFAKVIDRLLASPRYGEQWGRHWLDVVRYADTSGCNSDFPIPSAARYRDYVIQSFNEDKPYDQFLREQIAGDLLPADNDEDRFENIIATGYLAISRRFGSRNNEFHLTIEDTIDNVGKAMLGLSVSCARCHDHKYDPISARDYYALYGIFNSTRYAFPGTEIYRHPKDFIPLVVGEEARRVRKYQEELGELDDRLENLKERKRALDRTIAQAQNDQREHAEDLLELKKTTDEIDATEKRLKELESNAPQVEKAYAVTEGKPGDARFQKKGDPRALGDEVPRGFLSVLGGQQLPPDAKGSGRLELAEWITDPKNPLTARVMVNRIWQHHIGKGIVPTPNDFGARGLAPTHPELLDYLATRFVESGWSVKAMHRLIMLSAAYQRGSGYDAKNAMADVKNELLWRFDRRRLSAEEIRDSILAVSGGLDLGPAGEHPFPPEKEWRYTQHKPFVADYESDHRSVYLMQQRIRRHPYLELFDGADPNATTAGRPLSTTPVQALFMMNNPLVHEQAGRFVERLDADQDAFRERIDLAYRLAFGRHATADEWKMARAFLAECRAALDAPDSAVPDEKVEQTAWASFARVLFSSNEFIFVD